MYMQEEPIIVTHEGKIMFLQVCLHKQTESFIKGTNLNKYSVGFRDKSGEEWMFGTNSGNPIVLQTGVYRWTNGSEHWIIPNSSMFCSEFKYEFEEIRHSEYFYLKIYSERLRRWRSVDFAISILMEGENPTEIEAQLDEIVASVNRRLQTSQRAELRWVGFHAFERLEECPNELAREMWELDQVLDKYNYGDSEYSWILTYKEGLYRVALCLGDEHYFE